MAGPIITSNLQLDLLPMLYEYIGLSYKDYPEEFSHIFTVLKSGEAVERFAKMTGMGLMTAFGETESVTYQDFREFWKQSITHTKYGTAVAVSMEALMDTHSGVILKQKSAGLARSESMIKELLAANYIDNGHTTVNGGDGVPLFSASHPRIDGGTVSNVIAGADMSEKALEDMIRACMNIVDEQGLALAVQPQKLFVARDNYAEAARILLSEGQVYTPDNTINVIKSQGLLPGGYEVNHYFTDQNACLMTTNAVPAEQGLVHYVRLPLTLSADNVFDNDMAKFKAVTKFSFAHKDPLCVFGNPGSS